MCNISIQAYPNDVLHVQPLTQKNLLYLTEKTETLATSPNFSFDALKEIASINSPESGCFFSATYLNFSTFRAIAQIGIYGAQNDKIEKKPPTPLTDLNDRYTYVIFQIIDHL